MWESAGMLRAAAQSRWCGVRILCVRGGVSVRMVVRSAQEAKIFVGRKELQHMFSTKHIILANPSSPAFVAANLRKSVGSLPAGALSSLASRSTDKLLPTTFLLAAPSPSSLSSLAFPFPTSPLLLGLSSVSPFTAATPHVALAARIAGVPGLVGGRAIGALLIECAARLCPSDALTLRPPARALVGPPEGGKGGGACGERVFVKVMVTLKGSPAK